MYLNVLRMYERPVCSPHERSDMRGRVRGNAAAHGGSVKGVDRPMPNATADGITLINFGMGSPNAATVMDLLSDSRLSAKA
jgi:hypothetical protein